MHFYRTILIHFYLPTFLDVYNLVEISTLGLVVYVHLSGNNFERSISASDHIKYVPLFNNISRYLLLRRNPDFEV